MDEVLEAETEVDVVDFLRLERMAGGGPAAVVTEAEVAEAVEMVVEERGVSVETTVEGAAGAESVTVGEGGWTVLDSRTL